MTNGNGPEIKVRKAAKPPPESSPPLAADDPPVPSLQRAGDFLFQRDVTIRFSPDHPLFLLFPEIPEGENWGAVQGRLLDCSFDPTGAPLVGIFEHRRNRKTVIELIQLHGCVISVKREKAKS